jgi:precorrin-2 dehydrogenase/sirohydrochlorin ferrochelatase
MTRGTVDLDYPTALRLAGRPVLMVGGGKVAAGRLDALLLVGAKVHVVALRPVESIRTHAAAGRVRLSERPYQPGDCAGAMLVLSATDDLQVNRTVAAEARRQGLLVNVADMPELCDFHLPSVGRQGPIAVAVSTAGQSPGLARQLRRRLMRHLSPEHGQLAGFLGTLRRTLPAGRERTELLERLLDRLLARWRL